MRRVFVIIVPALAFAGMLALSRATANWHYVVSGAPGDVLYAATFDDFAADWQQYDDGQLSAQVQDGALRLTVSAANSFPYSLTTPHFGDFDLRVQALAAAGPLNNGYGVIFRQQSASNRSAGTTWGGLIAQRLEELALGAPGVGGYYLFLVSSDGYYQVQREVNGTLREISTWIPSPAVHQGLETPNTLRVAAKGNRLQFYVNDQRVALCIPDNPDARSTYNELTGECAEGQMLETLVDDALASGRIGVVAQSFGEPGVVATFDNLIVLSPEAIPEEAGDA